MAAGVHGGPPRWSQCVRMWPAWHASHRGVCLLRVRACAAVAQAHKFSEPATFMLTPKGAVKYLECASAPMGGRVSIDSYIAGYQWSTQNAKEHPEFASVVWGAVPQPALPLAH